MTKNLDCCKDCFPRGEEGCDNVKCDCHNPMTTDYKERKYVTTKEECETHISGVCTGCGGPLEAIETVDNSGQPTFWQGCNHCSKFDGGCERRVWEIARYMVEKDNFVPYRHMPRNEYEDTPGKLEYWLDSQTSGAVDTVRRVKHFLENHPAL